MENTTIDQRHRSGVCLEEIHEHGHILEILDDIQSQCSEFRVHIIEGLGFDSRRNLMQQVGKVFDEFTIDHIRAVLELEQKFSPHLDRRCSPQISFPVHFIPGSFTRHHLADFCSIEDAMQPLMCSGIKSTIWEDIIVKHPEDSPIRFDNVRLVNIFMTRCNLFFGDLQVIVFRPGRVDGVFLFLTKTRSRATCVPIFAITTVTFLICLSGNVVKSVCMGVPSKHLSVFLDTTIHWKCLTID